MSALAGQLLVGACGSGSPKPVLDDADVLTADHAGSSGSSGGAAGSAGSSGALSEGERFLQQYGSAV